MIETALFTKFTHYSLRKGACVEKGRLLGKGRTAEIYAWSDGQILKLFHDFVPEGWIQHEAHVGRVVMEAGLNTPNIGSLIKLDGRRGLLYERVNGPTMLSIVTKQPWRLFELAACRSKVCRPCLRRNLQ
jgi:hypothetical protein